MLSLSPSYRRYHAVNIYGLSISCVVVFPFYTKNTKNWYFSFRENCSSNFKNVIHFVTKIGINEMPLISLWDRLEASTLKGKSSIC